MSDKSTEVALPTDANNHPINRAMAVPLVEYQKTLGGTAFVDIIDLTEANFKERIFHGISVENPSGSNRIFISFDEPFPDNDDEISFVVGPQKAAVFDNQTFGYGGFDKHKEYKVQRIRARLESPSGTLSVRTLDYTVNPSDQETIVINGITYEFSSDQSVAEGRVKVDIGVDADATFTNLRNAINSADQGNVATINTGGDQLTLTSKYGGAYGDNTLVVDASGVGGVTVNAITSGTGGVTPTFHIW